MARHRFKPNTYYNTLGSHPPALNIADGDRVCALTADARGCDESGETVANRGNPMSGPFFVEGAEPGDALAVTLHRLFPNRPTGFTGTRIAPNVLDPEYVPDFEDEMDTLLWAVDNERRTVRPIGLNGTLGDLELPLEPMVGCFGVAPPRGQAISTATSSTHGGNMDYRGFGEGVTVYFPVFVPGALFHIGDGHAVQGDGEIVGTGIEISFEMEFSVKVIKGADICWPRAEDIRYLMVAGNARPLDQCVQHATTEMVQWLKERFEISTREVHILLGQAVEYDVGNVYDPAYTMICKFPKSVLDSLGLLPDGTETSVVGLRAQS